MSISDEQMQELSTVIKETGERLIEDYYPNFCESLGELGLFDPGGFPLELWPRFTGVIGQAGESIPDRLSVAGRVPWKPDSFRLARDPGSNPDGVHLRDGDYTSK